MRQHPPTGGRGWRAVSTSGLLGSATGQRRRRCSRSSTTPGATLKPSLEISSQRLRWVRRPARTFDIDWSPTSPKDQISPLACQLMQAHGEETSSGPRQLPPSGDLSRGPNAKRIELGFAASDRRIALNKPKSLLSNRFGSLFGRKRGTNRLRFCVRDSEPTSDFHGDSMARNT